MGKIQAYYRGFFLDDLIDGGRPHIDEIILIKLLVRQQWHGLSDYELEIQPLDRASFQHFLGYPDSIPDRSTIWRFRERLIKNHKEEAIWKELQRRIVHNPLPAIVSI